MSAPNPPGDDSGEAIPYPEDYSPGVRTEPPRSVWKRMSLSRIRWVLIVGALAVAAAFGGLKTADHVTPVALGQPYDDGPLNIVVHSARTAATMPEFRYAPTDCQFVVVEATIENTADRSVPFPTAAPVLPMPKMCDGSDRSGTSIVEMDGFPARFIGALRGDESIVTPTIEPGFTDDFRLVWTLPRSELTKHPRLRVRLPQQKEDISTFRIAEDWFGEGSNYGVVELPVLETP